MDNNYMLNDFGPQVTTTIHKQGWHVTVLSVTDAGSKLETDDLAIIVLDADRCAFPRADLLEHAYTSDGLDPLVKVEGKLIQAEVWMEHTIGEDTPIEVLLCEDPPGIWKAHIEEVPTKNGRVEIGFIVHEERKNMNRTP